MQNNMNMIYPCPFSRGYGIPETQAWQLLNIFFLYRFVISSLFVIFFFNATGPYQLGATNPQLYIYSSLGYLILSIVAGLCIYYRYPSYTSQTQLLIFTDIIFITLLMHASGGIVSGIGILLTVTTAAGGLLIGGRCAMLFAAMASLAILAEQIYASQHAGIQSAYSYAGMLGAAFFTIALLAYILAKRSEQREQTISQLEVLNRHIIQNLEHGIIIVDQNLRINMMNNASLVLFNSHSDISELHDISPSLNEAFAAWQQESSKDYILLRMPGQSEIHIHFTVLRAQHKTFYMLTLEDVARYNQRIQQNKLASLGRLSASIAHEIRNPLGAISHAGQLLAESPVLTDQDRRLTQIIDTHCQRVNRIIEDILQLSRKKTSLREKIHLQSWLRNFLTNFMTENSVATHRFVLVADNHQYYGYIDPNHLKQIMDNLCHNALKYANNTEQNSITIRTGIFKKSPCIEVIDQGPGVNKENIERLFEPFFTTSNTGTGLGLYICRELAELNQAKLSYYLTEHNGSCFQLCFSHADKAMIEL